jgi:hypothetical protein
MVAKNPILLKPILVPSYLPAPHGKSSGQYQE